MTRTDTPYIWDSWYLYNHEEQQFDVYYLNVDDHALVPKEEHHFHARIGYATTRDFESYSYIGHDVMTATSDAESRDNTSIWTGCSVAYGTEGQRLMAYTSRDVAQAIPEGITRPFTQHISFATSADGIQWERITGAHIDADRRFYSTASIPHDVVIHAWRDPAIFRVPGNNHAYMLLSAHARGLPHGIKGERNGTHGVIALLRTTTERTLTSWESTGISFAVDVPEAEVPRMYIDTTNGRHMIAYSCKNDAAYVPHTPDPAQINYGFYGFYVDMEEMIALIEGKSFGQPYVIHIAEEDKIPLLARGEDTLYACQVVPELGGSIIGFDTKRGSIRASTVRQMPHLAPPLMDFSDFSLTSPLPTGKQPMKFSDVRNVLCIGMPVADVLIGKEHAADIMLRYRMVPGVRNMLSASEVAQLEAEIAGKPGVQIVAGGSMANTASAVAQLCPDVTFRFCAASAADHYGDIFSRALGAAGIAHLPASRMGQETSRSYVMTDSHGERAVARYLGDSMSGLEAHMIERYIAEADLLLLEGELPALPNGYKLWRDMIALAKKHHTLIGFSLFGAEQVNQHRALFMETLEQHADCVFGNEQEISALYADDSDNYTQHCDNLLKIMHKRQPQAVLCISHGKGAPYLATPDGIFRNTPSPVEHVVNTLGAGDAFMAGVCAGLLDGNRPEACLMLGHTLAAAVIQQEGPQLGHEKLLALKQGCEDRMKTGS
jgi:sugar/nucleoside kinase (ribokinase family)